MSHGCALALGDAHIASSSIRMEIVGFELIDLGCSARRERTTRNGPRRFFVVDSSSQMSRAAQPEQPLKETTEQTPFAVNQHVIASDLLLIGRTATGFSRVS